MQPYSTNMSVHSFVENIFRLKREKFFSHIHIP